MNLDSAPYFDDYSELKNFTKVLFKPGPAVQARELNQLQTLLQKQVQRFGDNILKQGTIVSGGQITHHPIFPYVKIRDVNSAAGNVNVTSLIGRYVRNSSGVSAVIVTAIRGQEATAPDLNTLYVRYIATATNNTTSVFSASDVLTVFDATSTDAATITVAFAGTNPIGTGYGLTIDEGVVYHAGYFTRSARQLLVITKYTDQPNNLCVGFDTSFEIVTADDDSSLYNNANGFTNFSAPGADRLKATAVAIVITKSDAQTRPDFLSLVEFTQGEPYKLDPTTQYNVIDQTLARRTFEESGNYVVDRFLLNTRSPTIDLEPTTLQAVVDPGVGYLNGYRIATTGNYTVAINKGIATRLAPASAVSVDYGNYIIVNRVNGDLSSIIGSTINLNDTAQTFAIGATVNIIGGNIGSARVRGIEYVSRDATVSVKLYLFDVLLNAGYTFQNALSVNGPNFAANLVGVPNLVDTTYSKSIFNGPTNALKAVSNVSVVVQKGSWGTLTSNTSGYLAFTLSGTDMFETTGALTQDQLNGLLIAPAANTVGTTNRTGTVATTSGSPVITGTSTTFTVDFVPGDWLSINGNEKLQIAFVSNNTSATSYSNSAVTGSGFTYNNFYPARAPVRALSGVVSAGRQTLTVQTTRSAAGTNYTAIVPVRQVVTAASKSVTRNVCARIDISANISGIVVGPWALGHSDVIRLKGVYKGANTTFISSDAGVVDVTSQFYIDANHNTDYIGTGYLYKKATSLLNLLTTDRLLVVFDILTTSSNGVRTIASYPINDGVTLAASNTTINTLELPEVFGAQDSYYDVRDVFDFRPITANTIAVNTSQSSAAVNPSEPSYNARYASIGIFPAPHSTIVSDVEFYLPRHDRVVVDTTGTISVIAGQAGSFVLPSEPRDCLTVNTLTIPPYPSIPNAMSVDLVTIADTRISNEKFAHRRLGLYGVQTTLTENQISKDQPRGYTMEQIGRIDSRLADIEYYVALTRSESQAKSRLIPSAIAPSTDRFKFGLFVDSFTDSSLADLDNPQYAASIASGVLQPKTDSVVVQLEVPVDLNSGGLLTLPYSSVPLIQQLSATNGPITVIVTPPPVANTSTGGVVLTPPPLPATTVVTPPPAVDLSRVSQQEIVSLDFAGTNTQASTDGSVYTIQPLFASGHVAPIVLYFNSTYKQIAVEVYQGTYEDFPLTAPIYSTANAIAVDGTDTGQTSTLGVVHTLNTATVAGRLVSEGAGKISWAHNPTNGIFYKIKVYHISRTATANGFGFSPDPFFKSRILFPLDGYTITGAVQESYSSNLSFLANFTNFGYDGVTSVSPTAFSINSTTTTNGALQYYLAPQKFRISVFGLKPNTGHVFFFDGVNFTSDCTPIAGTASGGLLVTDGSGVLTIDFACNPAKGFSNLSDLTILNLAIGRGQPLPKVFTFQSVDGLSIVDGLIGVSSYAGTLNTITTSTPTAVNNLTTGVGGGFRERTHINSN
jgi:hypothetical protein